MLLLPLYELKLDLRLSLAPFMLACLISLPPPSNQACCCCVFSPFQRGAVKKKPPFAMRKNQFSRLSQLWELSLHCDVCKGPYCLHNHNVVWIWKWWGDLPLSCSSSLSLSLFPFFSYVLPRPSINQSVKGEGGEGKKTLLSA